MSMLGFFIFLSTMMYLDYKVYLRGNDSIFFKDKTELEKKIRKIQELEVEAKLKELQTTIKEEK